MKHQFVPKIAIVIVLFSAAIGALSNSKAEAQGGVRFRPPFSGTHRWTSYVDHRSPDYSKDGYMVVYLGEERGNCPDPWPANWDPVSQGPYCYDSHNGIDYAMPDNTPVLATEGCFFYSSTCRDCDTNHYIATGNAYEHAQSDDRLDLQR